MLTSVFAKTIRDSWLGWFIAYISLVALLIVAMMVYAEVDPTFIDSLPEVYRSMLGIPEGADVASLSINALVGTYGALTICAMALAMGAAFIAGEERKGTFGLLLGNPKSRTSVLVSKTAALVLFTTICVFALYSAVIATAAMLDISIKGMDVEAFSLHLLLNCLFYGFLALAVGAATGNRGAALGASLGVMILSFVGVGVLPLIEGGQEWVKIFPWYYFSGSEPLLNGIDWGHLGVLAGGCILFAIVAVVGLNRRDIKSQSVGVTLVDRLRSNRMTEKVIGRLAGSARVSSIWIKTASEYQVHLVITAVYMFFVQGLMMGPMFNAIPQKTREAADVAFAAMPKAMMALFGGGGMSTIEDFYQIETFGMMAPIGIMIVAIAIGAGALAGEEERRTMGLLLANPITRTRIVLAKTWTMVLFSVLVGLATFTGVTVGILIPNLRMDIGNIAAACVLQTLVGLVFGALALTLSASTGKKNVAIWGAVGAALAFHVFTALTQLNDTLADWAGISPFHYYSGNDPLNNGLDWGNAAVLAAIFLVLIALSVVFFQRRDIKQFS